MPPSSLLGENLEFCPKLFHSGAGCACAELISYGSRQAQWLPHLKYTNGQNVPCWCSRCAFGFGDTVLARNNCNGRGSSCGWFRYWRTILHWSCLPCKARRSQLMLMRQRGNRIKRTRKKMIVRIALRIVNGDKDNYSEIKTIGWVHKWRRKNLVVRGQNFGLRRMKLYLRFLMYR